MHDQTAEAPAALPVIGWREWVRLPELGIKQIKAKIDSGARSSSLHARDIEEFERDGESWVRFNVHTKQRSTEKTVAAEARVIDKRSVRSSSGKASLRLVIQTKVELLGQSYDIELTLANRETMGFRMLLGREAFRGRFMIDACRSYLNGKPRKKKKKLPPDEQV